MHYIPRIEGSRKVRGIRLLDCVTTRILGIVGVNTTFFEEKIQHSKSLFDSKKRNCVSFPHELKKNTCGPVGDVNAALETRVSNSERAQHIRTEAKSDFHFGKIKNRMVSCWWSSHQSTFGRPV